MKREIIFRGRSKQLNKWVYGDLFHTGKNDIRIFPKNAVNDLSVDPETVGQFTGLQDRDGKDIYEGDLFKVDRSDRIFEVKFEDGCFVAYQDGTQYGIIGGIDSMYIKVIGNIHEKPQDK